MDRDRIELRLTVGSSAEARELDAAWREIVSGQKLPRISAIEQDSEAVMERARVALAKIENALRSSSGGQSRRLVQFLAAVYNGYDYSFDLTDLRALDTELANACLDYLNYDRLGKVEVHTHLAGGGQQMQRFITEYGLRPKLHFSSHLAHELRLFALAYRLEREPAALLNEAVEDLLSRHEAKSLGGLVATEVSQDEDRPLFHARVLSDITIRPACGASDGPWSACSFDFERLTCHECRVLVLNPDP